MQRAFAPLWLKKCVLIVIGVELVDKGDGDGESGIGDAEAIADDQQDDKKESDAGRDLDVIDKGEDLDENESGVKDASGMDRDVDVCQIESLIKKYS